MAAFEPPDAPKYKLPNPLKRERYVIHVDDHGNETKRYLDENHNMLPLLPPPRGGKCRDKAKVKAARKARRKNRG